MTIEAIALKSATQEILIQKHIAFPEYAMPLGEELDNIDCNWLVFICDGDLMVAGRIRSSYNGSIFIESKGIGYRNSTDTADIERYFITPKYRGTENLYEFFVLCSFEYAMSKGFKYAQSGLRIGRRLQQRIEKLHFDVSHIEIPLFYSSGVVQNCYPVTVDFEKSKNAILLDLQILKNDFEKKYKFIKSY